MTLATLTRSEKIRLLEAIDYGYDGQFVTRLDGSTYLDPYTGEPVTLDELVIMPGSAIVIGNNPVSIAGYAADYLANP